MPAALLLFLCIACNSRSGEVHLSTQKADSAAVAIGAVMDEEKQRATDDQVGPGTGGVKRAPSPTPHAAQGNPDWDKKIVKTADLKVEVKNFKSYTMQLHRLIQQAGGYIAREQQSQSDYSTSNIVTIKVPVDRFDEVLMEAASDSDKVVEKKISSEDVTMEVIDTKSRLETKKEVRERYLELLRQARSMKDILAVQSEIDGIQEQMDQASGRIAYLGHSAAFSTINLDFYQVLNPAAHEEYTPSFLHGIKNALREGWGWSSNLLLGLISLWPLWIAVSLAWFSVRKWRAGLAKKAKLST
jgi:hypothetical protein